MAKMIDVTLVGDISGQPTSDTVIIINSDYVIEISSDSTGNSNSKIKMNDGKIYSVKETIQELKKRING
ncbi:MAG TPA: hypothetical protein DHV48_04740 [Prolixibacteraceae bacterium]|nr:hypothetical protein [Prolixibacteraceae bacterium]